MGYDSPCAPGKVPAAGNPPTGQMANGSLNYKADRFEQTKTVKSQNMTPMALQASYAAFLKTSGPSNVELQSRIERIASGTGPMKDYAFPMISYAMKLRYDRKRWMMRLFQLWLFALATIFPAAAADSRPPNVVLIYTDDQGSVDLGCYGADDLLTPHTDRLAETGIRFTTMYAPAPICSPSRAGLLTGRYPATVGVPGNVGRGGDGGLFSTATMAQMFQRAGYATALTGKWHLGHGKNNSPKANGFDHWFGHLGGCIDNYSHFFYWNGPNEHDLWRNGKRVVYDGKYFPDLVIDEAERFIERNQTKPFFLYVALNTPHYPYQGGEKWLKHYRDAGVPYPRDLYNAFVTSQDDQIGRLTKILEDRGLREDTVIIFQSDHGHSVEERAHFGGGNAGPFRGSKQSLFEGGLRVPSIISYPKRLPEKAVRNQMVHAMDWLPTLAELCGIVPIDTNLDGRSMMAIFESEKAEEIHETFYWTYGRDQWAVRHGPWKLIRNPRNPVPGDPLPEADREWFLSHLERDPGERKNLASEHPEVVEQLKAARPAWARLE